MAIFHFSCSLVSVVLTRKALSSSTAEMATMAPISFIFRSEKPTLPIQAGRSSWSPMLSLETKFS
jgi:hypothetical protein